MTKAKTPYRIIWRPIAEADLDNIIDYIAQDNPTRA
jgi:toxin ParE1/3/4